MTLAMFALIALGLGARAWHYLANYSLNHDDACLALNLISRNWSGLFKTLDYEQAAPVGFLLGESALVHLFGSNEYALRIWPALASLTSVPAFWWLASKKLERSQSLVAVGFFSVSQALVGASALVKQYSTEVLVSILLAIAFDRLFAANASKRGAACAAITGTVAVWFSFPAVFFVGGTIATLLIAAWRDRGRLASTIGICSIWLSSIALAYFFSIRPGLQDSALLSMWTDDFIPISHPRLLPGSIWRAVKELGAVSTSVRLGPPAALCLIIAVAFVAVSKRSDLNLAIVFTMCLTFLAAGLQRYPLSGRFLFFAAPLVLLLTCGVVGDLVRTQSPQVSFCGALAVSAALLYSALSLVKNDLNRNVGFDDPRGVLAEVRREWTGGDIIYASHAGTPPLLYYQKTLGIGGHDFVTGRDPAHYSDAFANLAQVPIGTKRIWFVYFWPTEKGLDAYVLKHLQLRGDQLSEIVRKNYTAALWGLKQTR